MRHVRWIAPAAMLAALLTPPFIVAAGVFALGGGAGGGGWAPTQEALEDIPPEYLQLYQVAPAEWCPGLPWPVLAAIGKIETDHGRTTLPGVHSGANFAGAAGPMQIGVQGAAGNTWGGESVRPVPPDLPFGVDGDHDGVANVYDPADAIPAAATYLCAHGAPDDLESAIWAYNHSDAYVRDVLDQANRYGTPIGIFGAGGGIVCPVPPPVHFVDTWGAPRSGGRTHQGQDLFAAYAHPLVAVTTGTITETRTGAGLGGTILWLETPDGAAWYYAHLSGFAHGITDGVQVVQGQVIAFNGNTGNAATTPPHLHIQYRPTGRHGADVNPYAILSAACPGHLAPLP
ncbi:MAG: peptidoglycan DD-metalloendopeptidase family protein [Actinomycetota bacterium]